MWSPKSQHLIDKIERVQRKFVKHLAFQSGVRYDDYSYLQLCNRFNLSTLEARRNVTDLSFVNKLVNNRVNCNFLTSCIYLSVPLTLPSSTTQRTLRSRNSSEKSALFCTDKKCRLVIRKSSFFPRTTALLNTLPDDVDVFDTNIAMFKRSVSVYFI